MTDRALVLAGGGLAGIAEGWPGFADALADPAARFVGTSAGSAVASQVAADIPITELYAGQQAEETAELGADIDLERFQQLFADTIAGATSPEDARRRIGAMARTAVPAASAGDRRAVIAARLLAADWPERDLRITAVDADTGELVVFTPEGTVPMLDAVAASCAVPGVWPVVAIDGRDLMDGGVRSSTNLDLAAGAARILVLVPSAGEGAGLVDPAETDAVAGARLRVEYADATSVAAFGPNPLDPAVRPASAAAGRAQGLAIASAIEELLG